MYYNQGEDQMFIPKKKPYNEACDSGHDIDQAEEALRAEAAREAEARAEEAIARAEEARARAAEANAEAARLIAKAKCKKRHKKEKENVCKRKHKKKK
ncbi:hypothetical protein ACPA1T_15905 [Bacillus amyloliquefaciens]|uniref:hypothetical protein n=1 Tax=Bacillus amyloliquefaciens TaxID=1390 RepID=UPI003C70E71D